MTFSAKKDGKRPMEPKMTQEELIKERLAISTREYKRLLVEHNITQSMSRKGNCMDNGIMENFFGRLKMEMYYGEKFESPREFIEKLEEYIHYYNNERISLKLKGMSPVQYRVHSQAI